MQLYKYNMEGFLHWGFNFYNSQYSCTGSIRSCVNDSEDAFPAGDPFIVSGQGWRTYRIHAASRNGRCNAGYPAAGISGILTSREHVLELLEGADNVDIRFDQYPLGPDYLLDL